MFRVEFPFPIHGLNKGEAVDKQPTTTSGHIKNVRPYDTLSNRKRGGSRPGLKKLYAEQVSGGASPVVLIQSIMVVT